jgi:hypothetical protein
MKNLRSFKPTDCLQYRPSLEADSRQGKQGISRQLYNRKFIIIIAVFMSVFTTGCFVERDVECTKIPSKRRRLFTSRHGATNRKT